MMSYLRMYRDKFVESNDLEYIYTNHSLKFVDYMEQIGLGDKIVEIGSQQLKDSVSCKSLFDYTINRIKFGKFGCIIA